MVNLLSDQEMLIFMHEAANINGFFEYPRKKLKEIVIALAIKYTSNHKNDFS